MTPTPLGSGFKWKMSNVEKWCCANFASSGSRVVPIGFEQHCTRITILTSRRILRVLSHYRFPGPFSIELTGAVTRQGTFIEKMVNMGWTAPRRFTADPSPLVRAIARYHAFLDLTTTSISAFFVPTLVRILLPKCYFSLLFQDIVCTHYSYAMLC